MKEVTGWHVFAMFALAFGIIIAVNLTLAFNAIRTFPGLEVKNSYVASQSFDLDRAAQEGLNWKVSADLLDNVLVLRVMQNDQSIAPEIVSATFGRATNVAQDETPQFVYARGAYRANVDAGAGNWNLRIKMLSDTGTLFQQRIIVRKDK